MDALKNFAIATVSTGYDADDTSIDVASGEGARFPAAPFYAVWWNSTDYANPADDPDVEIVRVTNVSTDTLTITRAQEGTAAATHNTGGKTYKLIQAVTAALLAQLAQPSADFGADNVLLRSDGTGRAVQATGITVDDSDNVAGVENLDAASLSPDELLFAEGAAPATPASGKVALYAKTDGKLYIKDDAGTETDITTPGSGSTTITGNDQTGTTYTLVLTDAGKIVRLSNASAIAVTVPTNASVAFPVGTVIMLERVGAGAVTIAGDSGVTVNAPGAANAIAAQHALAFLRKSATDTWTLGGDIA